MQTLAGMRRSWTVQDLRELDVEDWRRYEIVDGALLVSPPPTGKHELTSEEVRAAIRGALPVGLAVIGPMGIGIERSYLIPDLVVAQRTRVRSVDHLDPADALLVVEVVSPGSVTTDRVTKPAQYAAAGIPAFWRVETDPISVSAYVLRAGTYAEVGTWGLGETARITEPFPVKIELNRLTDG
jgi:Uma2 family endonuclease